MRQFSVAVILLLGAVKAYSQEAEDTTRVYELGEIVVTATRTPISEKDSPSPVELMRVGDIPRWNGTSVADLLRLSQGIFLQDYGAQGALKTASLRGTASQHLLVLRVGVRINVRTLRNSFGLLCSC